MPADTGIAPVGWLDWGSHFCHFYKTAEDLGETLLPFFNTGLDHNEACIWVTAKPYPKERALQELNARVTQLDRRLASGQLKVFAHDEWYAIHGAKSRADVARAWIDATERALADGYSALRLTGNTAFLERPDWDDFMEYENVLRGAFVNQKLIALCSYDADRCDADAVLDVVRAHDFAIARRQGAWELVESAAVKRTKAELVALNAQLESRITERTRALSEALDHQRLLTAELSHRVKNTLASIQTIVRQTLRRGGADAEARETLGARLGALARVHEQLATVEWRGVPLSDVIAGIASPFGARIAYDVRAVHLTPRATLDFGLIFHELATNAAKYGALGADGGRVRVRVTVDPGADPIEIAWEETGAGPAHPPLADGFGLRLIRQLVAHDLKGECETRFGAGGFTCTIRAPRGEVVMAEAGCGHAGRH